MRSLRAFLGLGPAAALAVAPPLPRPQPPICVIGDLHGRADLLELMLTRIASQPQAVQARLVFVGDMIDRGPNSAAVLARLQGLCMADPARHICLMGNHERMMLAFLAAPTGRAKRWLSAGGIETLASFGINGRMQPGGQSQQLLRLAEALHLAIPPAQLAWLRQLPLFWQSEGLAVVHASAAPDLPMAAQPETALLWRHHKPAPRRDGLWIAHGHVITAEAQIENGAINVDTGAWRSGRLSAVWLDANGASVLQVVA